MMTLNLHSSRDVRRARARVRARARGVRVRRGGRCVGMSSHVHARPPRLQGLPMR